MVHFHLLWKNFLGCGLPADGQRYVSISHHKEVTCEGCRAYVQTTQRASDKDAYAKPKATSKAKQSKEKANGEGRLLMVEKPKPPPAHTTMPTRASNKRPPARNVLEDLFA